MLVRIDKMLSQLQIATRSESKKLLSAGRVRMNDTIVKNGAVKFNTEKDQLFLDDQLLDCAEFQYFLLYKPAGCVTATEDQMHKTVMDYLPAERHRNLSPVGRLDKDTEGLLLITDDGALNHELLAPGRHVEKEYYAKIRGVVNEGTIEKFAAGLDIGEKKLTAPAKLVIYSCNEEDHTSEIRVTITEGKFHQVKRMFQAVGMKVLYLKRLRMGSLVLDDTLKPGQYRSLTQEEINQLKCRSDYP